MVMTTSNAQPMEMTDEPPDPRWLRTVWAVWFAHLLSAVGFSFVMPFLPFYVRELGVTDDRLVGIWAGVAMTAAGLSLTIFQPIWGGLADRYGRKLMLERAMFGGALALGAIAFVQNAPQLVLLRFIQGALTGTGSACNTLVAAVCPRKRLGFTMGLLQTSQIAGNAFGPWVGGVVADAVGYRTPFLICAALWILAGIVVHFGAIEGAVQKSSCAANGTQGLREAFGGKGTAALLGAFFLPAFAATFVGPIFPLFVERIAEGARAATVTGQLMGVAGLASGISCLLVGRISDRLGHRRVLVVSSLGSALFSAPHAIVQTLNQLFALRISWGLISGGGGPAMSAMIGNAVSSDSYGRAFGLTSAASCLGSALGPLVGGLMASAMGLRLPFVVMSVMWLGAAVLVALYVHPRPAVAAAPPDECMAAK